MSSDATQHELPDRLLTAHEAARRLGLSRATVYRHARTGELPALRVGGSLRFDPAELEQYVYGTPKGGSSPSEADVDRALSTSSLPDGFKAAS